MPNLLTQSPPNAISAALFAAPRRVYVAIVSRYAVCQPQAPEP